MKIWNNLSKRGLALFLVLTMCVSLLPATALATELEELNHIHNEDGWVCEEAQGDLTCDIEEHRHSDECYAPGEPVLSCALTDDEGHTHGDSCYSEEENLTLACGLEESEEHTHSEDCYTMAVGTVLACGLEESEGHAHDEACFTGGEGVLVCETAEHTHGGECYETVWSCASPSKNIQRFLRAVRDIPEEITAADEGAVIAARQAYDLLTEDELPNPAVVVGLVTLEHAETLLAEAKAEEEPVSPEDPVAPEYGTATIQYYAGNGGTVSLTEEVVTGDNDALGSTATPSAGYAFKNWTNDRGEVVSTSPVFKPVRPAAGYRDAVYAANFVAVADRTAYFYILKPGGSFDGDIENKTAWYYVGTGHISATEPDYKNPANSVSAGIISGPDVAYPEILFDNHVYTYSDTGADYTYTVEWLRMAPASGANNGETEITTQDTWHVDGRANLRTPEFRNATFYFQDAGAGSFAIDKAAGQDATYLLKKGTCVAAEKIPAHDPTKVLDGVTYTFDGWYLTDACTGAKVNPATYSVNADTSFFAKYSARYTVTASIDNGGNITGGSSNIQPGGSVVITWTPAENYRVTEVRIDGKVQPTPVATGGSYTFTDIRGNHTVEVKTATNTIQVTYVYQGAESGNSETGKTVIFGRPYGDLPVPKKPGYTFDGWFTAATGGSKVTSKSTVENAEDHTLYAQWSEDTTATKELSYTVEYYKDGVKEGEPETITETVQFLETQVPVKAGKINTTDKFGTLAYRFDKVVIGNQDVGTLPATVAPGTTIQVHYVSNTAAYTVEYYYGETESTGKGHAPILYAETADGAYTTYAAPAGDTAVIGTDVTVTPARFVKVDETCYVLWKVEPVTIQADPAPNAVKVHYLADTDGDGIPDAFQSKATYHVTGGSWSTSENVPEKTQVLTFKTWNEALGAWVDTVPAPAFETSLPTANSGYDPESGKWDENDPVQVSERPGMGKTYTFHYSFDLMYGYTVRYHFVDKNRQPVQGCERENANEKDQLDAGQSYVAVGTVVELSKLPKVVTFGSGGSTKKFVIVSGNTDRTVQRKTGGNPNVNVFDVYYGVDEIGTNNGPDDVADCFQATVTFTVEGGSWNNGSTGAPLVVTLTNPLGELDENGSYTLTNTDNIPEAGQNPDGTHRAAKDTDTNLWAPALSTPVTKDNHAFTYTYPSKNTMTVTVKGINRPYNGTEDAISVTVRDGGTELADAVIKYYSDAAYEKEITSFNNSFKDVADSTTIYIRVTHPDYTAVDTRAVVAITPVAVTVTADNKEMVYGGEMPKLTATVSGILTGEEGELAYKLDCAASSGSHAGEYAITVTGKQLNNYDVSYVSGTLTIKGQVFYKENAPRATDVTGMPERPTERHKAYKLGEVVPHTDLSTKVPVRKGYTFAGWSLASGEGNAVLANDEKVIMGETGVTLYAVWTQNTYTVKVNYRLTENGKDLEDYTNHTLPTSKDVGYPNGWSVAPTPGATITALENIVVDDKTYVLDGSLSSETLSGVAPKYEGPGTSVEVTLVYALDSNGNTTPDYLERFSLTYDANGGKGEAPADPKEYAQYEKATLEKTTSLSKDKAVFIGWSLTKHEELITSKETAGGAGIVSDVTFALADITVYAVWAEDENENDKPDYEEDRFTVTYTDGVDGAEIFEDQVYEDVLVDTPTPAFDGTPRRTGYTFTGWDPAVAGTVTADAAYTAQWRRNTYTITIEVINGTSNPEGSVTVSYNGSTTIHFSGNPGYELGFVTVDGKPAALANSAYTFSNVDRNHKIQVLYTQSTFTVTFVDGLTGETIEVRPGLVELPGEGTYPAAPAHEGYEFTGWTVGAPGANGNVTITANYKPIEVEEDTYTVTFVDGLTGETIEVRAGLVELPGEGTYPAAPAHEGYEFTGWTVGAPDANGNVTITANYKPIEVEEETFTVTFVDGLTGETIEVRTGLVELPGEGTYPAAPAHEGYEFTGWTVGAPDANGNVVITANYKPAEVEEDTYTVTWLNWNGVQLQQKVVKKGDPEPSYTGLPPTRLSDGVFSYTFIGWSAPSVDADGNVTYTAQYTATRIPVDPGPGPGPGPDPGPAPGPGPGGGDVTIPDNDPPLAGGDGTVTINDQEVPLAGAIGLNSVDHFAYIIGYDDDTVRPLNNITRAEVATIFFRLMTEDYRNANWATANDFSDVTAGSWFNNAVSTCANAGLLTGYPDGTFKPNQSITRAEFAAVAARFLSDEYTGENVGDFSDTKGHWAAKEIRRAAEAGWVTGSNNGFRPNDKINRAEVMTIVNRMLDRIPDAEHMLGTMKKWKDNPEDAWYYEAVQEATNEHAYERDELGVTEHWTEVLPASDWKNLEAAWANANTGKADEADESTEPTESAETVETVAP